MSINTDKLCVKCKKEISVKILETGISHCSACYDASNFVKEKNIVKTTQIKRETVEAMNISDAENIESIINVDLLATVAGDAHKKQINETNETATFHTNDAQAQQARVDIQAEAEKAAVVQESHEEMPLETLAKAVILKDINKSANKELKVEFQPNNSVIQSVNKIKEKTLKSKCDYTINSATNNSNNNKTTILEQMEIDEPEARASVLMPKPAPVTKVTRSSSHMSATSAAIVDNLRLRPPPNRASIPVASPIVRRLRKSTRSTRFKAKMTVGGNNSYANSNNSTSNAHNGIGSGSNSGGTGQNSYGANHNSKMQNKNARNRRTLFKKPAQKTITVQATTRFVNNVFYKGSYIQIGDIVSLVDGEKNVYYAQVRGLLVDAYCEKSAFLTWLIPTQDSPDPSQKFDPATYLIGPDEDFSRKLSYLEFVMHAPSNYYHDRNTPFPLPDTMEHENRHGGYIWTRLPVHTRGNKNNDKSDDNDD